MARSKGLSTEDPVPRVVVGVPLSPGSAFQGVAGQDAAVGMLSAALRHGRVAHAYLFVGPHGVGRELVARRLAAALLCTGRPPGAAADQVCGACSACARVDRMLHPDVHLCLPEAEAVRRGTLSWGEDRKPSADIKVEQVRALRDELRMTSFEGGWRVALFPAAERLRVEAANALLKTLEEPQPNSLIILCAPDRGAVLETLRSRCQRVAFAPLSVEVIAGLVAERADLVGAQAVALARDAAGSAGNALAGEAEHAAEAWARAQALLADLDGATATELMARAEAMEKDRDTLDRQVRALLRATLQGAEALLPAARSDGAAALRARRLVGVAAGVLQLRADLGRPGANVRLNLERFLMQAQAELQGFTYNSMNS